MTWITTFKIFLDFEEQDLKSSNTKYYTTTGYKKKYNPLKYLFFTKSYLIIWTNGNDGKFTYMVNDETKDVHKLSFLTDINLALMFSLKIII